VPLEGTWTVRQLVLNENNLGAGCMSGSWTMRDGIAFVERLWLGRNHFWGGGPPPFLSYSPLVCEWFFWGLIGNRGLYVQIQATYCFAVSWNLLQHVSSVITTVGVGHILVGFTAGLIEWSSVLRVEKDLCLGNKVQKCLKLTKMPLKRFVALRQHWLQLITPRNRPNYPSWGNYPQVKNHCSSYS
jgi:hypothetical protein